MDERLPRDGAGKMTRVTTVHVANTLVVAAGVVVILYANVLYNPPILIFLAVCGFYGYWTGRTFPSYTIHYEKS